MNFYKAYNVHQPKEYIKLTIMKQQQTLPVVLEVDFLVIGGTCAAAAFALAAHQAGAKVFLAAPHAYLGEDVIAGMRFWDRTHHTESSQASQLIFGARSFPPTPMQVKLSLEQPLVKHRIPFLLNTRLCGLWKDKTGRLTGATIANRAGFQLVRSKTVVDASMEGVSLQLMGEINKSRFRGIQECWHTMILEPDVSDLNGMKLDDFHGINDQGGKWNIGASRRQCSVDFKEGTPHDIRIGLAQLEVQNHFPGVFRHQSLPLFTVARGSPKLPKYDDLNLESGRIIMTESALNDSAEIWSHPMDALTLGEQFGKWAGERVASLRHGDLASECQDTHQRFQGGALQHAVLGLRPGKQVMGQVEWDASSAPILGSYDVVVVGGGTGGAPAGIGAARAGARTAILEAASALGGVGTLGQITKYYSGYHRGFTDEINQGVNQLERDPAIANDPWSWSLPAKIAWYHKTCHELGVAVWNHTICPAVWIDNGKVRGVYVASPWGVGVLEAGAVVDASGNADIAAAAGAPTKITGGEHIAVQGTGLAGVQPGINYNNSDHNFCDETDMIDVTAFLVSTRLKFENNFDCGELVDTRERRQIIGSIELDPADLLLNRTFPDTLAVATSNFDSHGFTIHPVFMVKPSDKKDQLAVDIPLRCLLPIGVERLIVTGLGMSAHRDALPVIRMQADVQNHGYAAGRASAIVVQKNEEFAKINIRELQQHLVDIGSLPQRVLTDIDSFPMSKEAIQKAVTEGWDSHAGLALIFRESGRSKPMIQQELKVTTNHDKKIRLAIVLSLLDDNSGADVLLKELDAKEWDKGWNYRGMHQFGMNMSEVDVLVVATGHLKIRESWTSILKKIDALSEIPDFSHCRAITMACEVLYPTCPHSDIGVALARLLERKGISGHSQRDLAAVQAALTKDPNENSIRNQSLREIHLARALYRCGDHKGIAKKILEDYSQDLRGHFARHARAILT